MIRSPTAGVRCSPPSGWDPYLATHGRQCWPTAPFLLASCCSKQNALLNLGSSDLDRHRQRQIRRQQRRKLGPAAGWQRVGGRQPTTCTGTLRHRLRAVHSRERQLGQRRQHDLPAGGLQQHCLLRRSPPNENGTAGCCGPTGNGRRISAPPPTQIDAYRDLQTPTAIPGQRAPPCNESMSRITTWRTHRRRLLPSGNILFAASPGVYQTPTHFFELGFSS